MSHEIYVPRWLKVALWLVVGGLFLNAPLLGWTVYEAREANRHATEANRILAERDFDRLFNEHERHRLDHEEILRRCGR